MADIILANYKILTLLPRFDIRLGFGESTLAQTCERFGVNQDFFLLVCNIYTYDEYLPSVHEIADLDIFSIIDYLKKSHDYYVNKRIGVIEQRINQIAAQHGKNYRIIDKFFGEYKQEILNHFKYEETIVFPNIIDTHNGMSVNFRIDQYESNHYNIDDKLSDLKNILIKYLAEDYLTEERNAILLDIFMFEEDLKQHTLIEDRILIPYVRKYEIIVDDKK